jgi:Co/Zn/Cd efflux system component
MAGCSHCATAPVADQRFRHVLWIALGVNAVMFVVELVASWLSGSLALQADALDFMGDSFNYAISLAVLGMGLSVRAKAAALKGLSMGLFGIWVLGSTLWRTLVGIPPDAAIMGVTGVLALVANTGVALLFFRYRDGDANMRSVWLCSRNDAVANIAVIAAAGGVAVTGTHWPDLLVAAIIAGLCLHSSVDVLRRAEDELRRDAQGSRAGSGASAGAGDD